MKKIILLSTVLFIAFSTVGIATYIKTKQNHSLDNLYQPVKKQVDEPVQTVDTNEDEQMINEPIEKEQEIKNTVVPTKKFKKPIRATILKSRKKPKVEIDFKQYSRAAIEIAEPRVLPPKEEDKKSIDGEFK